MNSTARARRIDPSRDDWWAGLRAPIVAAPMYRVTTAAVVLAAASAGIAAVIPAHNMESSAELDAVLSAKSASIHEQAPRRFAPWGVNLIAHASNPRFEEDLAIVVTHRCPLVVTSVGSPRRVIDAVHAYGGRVWCDRGSFALVDGHPQPAAAPRFSRAPAASPMPVLPLGEPSEVLSRWGANAMPSTPSLGE